MHLTNYSINKYSADYDRDDRDDAGSKRKFSSIKSWFEEMNLDYDGLWTKIDDIIVKTLIAAYPIVSHSYRTCFRLGVAIAQVFSLFFFFYVTL